MHEQRAVAGADLERALPVGQLGEAGAQCLGVARRSVARLAGSVEARVGIGAFEIFRGRDLRRVQELTSGTHDHPEIQLLGFLARGVRQRAEPRGIDALGIALVRCIGVAADRAGARPRQTERERPRLTRAGAARASTV